MRAKIPGWLGWLACVGLVIILAWLGRGIMADVRRLEERTDGLERVDSTSIQDRKDLREVVDRIERKVDRLIERNP